VNLFSMLLHWRCHKTMKPGVNLWSCALIDNHSTREREMSSCKLQSLQKLGFCSYDAVFREIIIGFIMWRFDFPVPYFQVRRCRLTCGRRKVASSFSAKWVDWLIDWLSQVMHVEVIKFNACIAFYGKPIAELHSMSCGITQCYLLLDIGECILP